MVLYRKIQLADPIGGCFPMPKVPNKPNMSLMLLRIANTVHTVGTVQKYRPLDINQ